MKQPRFSRGPDQPADLSHPSERLIRIWSVMDMTGLSRPTIYKLIARGEFPKPIHPLGHCRVAAWLESEVRQWIANRIEAAKH